MERYEISWIGKEYAKKLVNCNVTYKLLEDIKHNNKPENKDSENMLISGDNLEVLKSLISSHKEKVKMIYIDPPYNTGKNFAYSDKFSYSDEQLKSIFNCSLEDVKNIRKRYSKNELSHSAWLTFMYPRLYLARELLKDDGMIFISIDDNEQAQLKLLCDEVFGEENFVASFIWNKKNSAKGVPPKNMVVNTHEYIMCFAKSQNSKLCGKLRQKTGFQNKDNDPRGAWRLSNIKSTIERDKERFSIIDPKTGRTFENFWAFSKESLERMIKEDRIVFPKSSNGLPKQKEFFNKFKNPYIPIQSYLGLFDPQVKVEKDVSSLISSKVFLYRKPLELIKEIISQSDSNNEIFMDFFSGTGTTAHAIFQLNSEDSGNRKFICVQLPENLDEKSETYKVGFKNIFEITKARIELAAKKIQAENPNYVGDLGFKLYTLEKVKLNEKEN